MKQTFTSLFRILKSSWILILLLSASICTDALATVVSIPTTPGTDTTFFSPSNRKTTRSACRFILTASEIGITGTVSAIAFQKSSGSSSISVNYFNIYMKETTSSTVSTTVPSLTGYKLVGFSRSIKNDVTSGWVTINLSTDLTTEEIMTYSGGTNNLDVIFVKTNNETAVSTTDIPIYNCHNTSTTMTAYYYGTSALGTTFTGTTLKRPNVQLTIENTCAGKPSPGTVTGPATRVCSGDNFTLSPTGLSYGTGMHYQWQSRNSGSGAYTNMASTDTFVTLTTSTTINKDYRIYSQCLLSGQSDTSAGFTVNVLAPSTITAISDTTFCIGGSVTLSTPATSGITYTWFNGATSTGATGATYIATTSGTYSVKGTTTACPTGVSSNTKLVTVNPLPSAVVTALSPTTFCDGLSVVLEASTGAGYSYQWQKGSVDISGATSFSYTATTAGNYRVKVTNTTTSCNTFSAVTTVTVNPTPAAPSISGAGGKTSFCTSDNLLLSAVVTSGISYQWENTSGAISGATTNSYTATSANTYRLVAILGSCSTKSNALIITENLLPTASITPVGIVSFCNGDSLALNATTSPGVSYQWLESGTAIVDATTPLYYAKTSGVYSIRVTNTSTGCKDQSATLTVNIIAPIIPTISAASSPKFCIGGSVILNAIVDPTLTSQWQVGGGDIIGETGLSYTASTSGLYRMKVTNGVGCAAYSTPIKVTVNPLPNNTITVVGGTNICDGDMATISAPIVAGYTYQWLNAGVDISGEISSRYYAKTAGTFSVRITDSNSCQSTSISTPVTVKFVKTFYIHPYGNTFFCDGDTTRLATQKGFTFYQWYIDGVFIPGASDTFTMATKNGKYSVKVQDPVNGCFAMSAPFNIVVIPAPDTPYIVKSGSRLSTAVTGVTYQWYKNGVAIAGATRNFYDVPAMDGIYSVVVTNDRDCSKRAEINLTPTSVIEGIAKTYFIKVYPNPAQDLLNVEAPKGLTVTLLDLQGRVLFQQKEAKQIAMNQLAAGMYIIQFTDENNQTVATEKISKVDY